MIKGSDKFWKNRGRENVFDSRTWKSDEAV